MSRTSIARLGELAAGVKTAAFSPERARRAAAHRPERRDRVLRDPEPDHRWGTGFLDALPGHPAPARRRRADRGWHLRRPWCHPRDRHRPDPHRRTRHFRRLAPPVPTPAFRHRPSERPHGSRTVLSCRAQQNPAGCLRVRRRLAASEGRQIDSLVKTRERTEH